MRQPDPSAVAFEVRAIRGDRRWLGRNFTSTAVRIEAASLTPHQRRHLVGASPRFFEVVEILDRAPVATLAGPPAPAKEPPVKPRKRR